jgi:hypothetical protein
VLVFVDSVFFVENKESFNCYSLQFTIRWYTYIEGLGGLLGDVTKKGSL